MRYLIFILILLPSIALAAFPTDWGRKCEIQIDYTKVDANVTDFSVLITEANIPSEAFGAAGSNQALEGGGDVRFSSDANGSTRLDVEVVTWDSVNSTCQVWVEVPSISSSATTSIWIWYNKAGESQPARGAAYGSEAVWSNSYLGVWHMEEASGTIIDATSNNADMTEGPNTPDYLYVGSGSPGGGGLGYGIRYDVSGEHHALITPAAYKNLDAFTLTGWYQRRIISQFASNWARLFSANYAPGSDAYYLGVEVTKQPAGRVRTTSTYTSSVLSADSTEYAVNTLLASKWSDADGNLRIYKDGSEIDVTTATAGSVTITPGALDSISIGGNATSSTDREADGVIFEVHVANVFRSDAWLDAMWNNQNAPATFAIEQTPEDGPVGGEGGGWQGGLIPVKM